MVEKTRRASTSTRVRGFERLKLGRQLEAVLVLHLRRVKTKESANVRQSMMRKNNVRVESVVRMLILFMAHRARNTARAIFEHS